MTNPPLAGRACVPCSGDTPPISAAQARAMMGDLDGWVLNDPATTIEKRFEFKGFAKAVEMANLAAWLGNRHGHHPDIRFGWGYCVVSFTTHAAGGLTENDFICAARLDALLA
ncbi:MAG: 4a-hydroxytetrahydrobiopterin dehydratase [Paracoccus sp. (in: a-proteobacteria)]|nr:4a-hydroxytetrahydrobiopterin dehydratase [Paracoccus sp. (in: a-proteobacteria)]